MGQPGPFPDDLNVIALWAKCQGVLWRCPDLEAPPRSRFEHGEIAFQPVIKSIACIDKPSLMDVNNDTSGFIQLSKVSIGARKARISLL